MARPKRNRRVTVIPNFKGFSPVGSTNSEHVVVLSLEEYESIRLSDFELFHQNQAAKYMSVSRPTFSRIYESARRKVAEAFVTGASIVFEGGKFYFDSHWFFCEDCGVWFNSLEKDSSKISCALCNSRKVQQFSDVEFETEEVSLSCPKCKRSAYLSSKIEKITCPDCKIELL